MIEPSHYMFNHHKCISRINAIAAKKCLWPNYVMKNTLELFCFIAEV